MRPTIEAVSSCRRPETTAQSFARSTKRAAHGFSPKVTKREQWALSAKWVGPGLLARIRGNVILLVSLNNQHEDI
jgi:hypothetical protein